LEEIAAFCNATPGTEEAWHRNNLIIFMEWVCI
jgi:hypothetical protein